MSTNGSPVESEAQGHRWLWAQAVPAQFGFADSSTRRWARNGCPALQGQRLQTLWRHPRLYYRIDQLERIRRTPAPMANDPMWARLSEALRICRTSEPCIYRWAERICPYLGRKLRSKRVRTRQHQQEQVYLRADCEHIARAQSQLRAGGDARQRLAGHEARERYGFAICTLDRWRRYGCEALHGKKLNASPGLHLAHDGSWRWQWRYLVSELKRIAAWRREAEWVRLAEAKAICGCNHERLYNWATKFCFYLGRKLGSTIIRVSEHWQERVYRRQDCEEIARALSHPPPADQQQRLTAAEARNCYGFTGDELRSWRTRGCMWLDGRKLDFLPELRLDPLGCYRRQYAYLISQLELIATRRNGPGADLVLNDSEGRFVRHQLAITTYALPSSLSQWRRIGCPWLGGSKLRAKRVPVARSRRRGGLEWVYLEADLKEIARARDAGTEVVIKNRAPDGTNGLLSSRQAAELAACAVGKLHYWHRGNSPIPGGGSLRRENRTIGNRMFGYWHRGDVRKIAQARGVLSADDQPVSPPAQTADGQPPTMVTPQPVPPKKRPGRPHGTARFDPANDRQLNNAWDTKQYATFEELDRVKGLPVGTTEAAVHRERARRYRLQQRRT
jgi:hypothetical protein